MRPHPPGPDRPEQIGEYRLIGVLGEGGQGVVYLGEAPTGERVAIKVLRLGATVDSASHRRFLREADTARRVAAFCTAQVLDVGTHHDRPYVVSEYIPGMSLAAAVAADGPRTGHALQRLAVTTLTALAAIHRAGVVHRDFKPSNVILGGEGPVVIDFGIASADDHSTTGSGLVGTPAYVAPEQIAGQAPGTASDVFSWACTMAYAATGRLAFGGQTIPALLAAISTGEPDLSGVPAELRPLLQACLDKDPEARPSATTLLQRLTGDASARGDVAATQEATAEDALAPGIPDTQAGVASSRARRLTLGAAAGLTVLLATAAVVLVLRTGSPESTAESAPRVVPFSGTLLYSDDFSDRGNWDGYSFDPTAAGDRRITHGYEIDRGVYSIFSDKSVPNNGALSPVPAKNPGSPSAIERDVMIGATAEVRAGSKGQGAIGLMCRWDDEVPNGYAFLLGLDGQARIVRNARGTHLDVAPRVRLAPPRPGHMVRLQAACRGSGSATRLTFWIDGVKAIDTTDPQPIPDSPTSRVGLTARTPEAGGGVITVSFDDFSIFRSQ